VREALSHELGRFPTVADLAARLEVDEDDVLEATVAASGYRSMSLFTPVGGDEDGPTLVDRLGVEETEYEAVESHQVLQPLLAQLPTRERDILAMRFYGNMTQAQIADRIGISQMHVSRLLTLTLRRLREQATTTD
jgi:RNA polymerase sigma-B factor